MERRVMFYYDGFNFYRGLKSMEWKDCYWIDLYEFSQKLINKYDGYSIFGVHYFTAKPYNRDKRLRQNIWLDTNQKLHSDRLEVHYGKYDGEVTDCPVRGCPGKIHIPKEKQTDVNIAVNLLFDCFKNNCDVSVLISGDNDLIPAVRCIKNHYPNHRIHIIYPPNRNRSNLHEFSRYPPIHLKNAKEMLLGSKLEKSYTFPDGSISIVPSEWDV